MSQNKSTEQIKAERLRTVRTLFAVVIAVFAIAAAGIIIWLVRRDTPAKAVRSTMKQISSLDESAISQFTDHDGSQAAVSALRRFFAPFSCRILSVSQQDGRASADVRVTTPDAHELAVDIRTDLLKNADAQQAAGNEKIFDLMDRLLSEKTYPAADTEGTLNLSKTEDGWTIIQDSALSSLLLGNLPEYLSDPYLLTPEQVLTVYLEKLDSMSVAEWSETFGVNDLFSVYAPESGEIDTEFLTHAKDAFSYSQVQAETDGSVSEASVTITGIDTSSILNRYKEKLAEYGGTISAITDDSSALSEKSAQFLLEAIREDDSKEEYPVTVPMENNGNGWVITDFSSLTDALFGGMSAAVDSFSGTPEAEN